VSGHAVLLARFCAELPMLRAALRGSPERERVLALAVDAARQGAPLTDLLRQLGIPVSEQESVGFGQPPTRGSDGAPTTSPLPAAAHSGDGSYRCPAASQPCGRWAHRGPGDPLPTCHLYGQPMRFEPEWVR
jgi:hypothetical protein